MWKFLSGWFSNLWPFSTIKTGIEPTQPSDVLSQSAVFGNGRPDAISTVYSCDRIISEQVANLPQKLVNRTTAKRYNAFGLQELINTQPNPAQTWFELRQATVYNLVSTGNGFERVHRNPMGTITGLTNLKTEDLWAYKLQDNGKMLYWFKLTTEAGQVEKNLFLNSDEVLHYKGISLDGLFGITPLMAMALNTGTFFKALKSANVFFENGGLGIQVLETTHDVTTLGQATTAKEETNRFMEENHGYLKAGRLVPLPWGKKIVNLGMSFKDSDLVAGMMFNKKEIASVKGVPLDMLGEQAQGDGEQNRIQFLQNTLSPILNKINQRMNTLLPTTAQMSVDRIGFINDTEDFVIETFKDKAEGASKLIQYALWSPNDGMRAMGLPPVDNDYMNRHYMQQQMIPIEDYETYGQKKGLTTRENHKQKQNGQTKK